MDTRMNDKIDMIYLPAKGMLPKSFDDNLPSSFLKELALAGGKE